MSSPEVPVARLGPDNKLPAALFPGGIVTTDTMTGAINTAISARFPIAISDVTGLTDALAGSISNSYDLIPRAGFTNGVQPRNHMITGAPLPLPPALVAHFHTIGQASPPPAMLAGDTWEDTPL